MPNVEELRHALRKRRLSDDGLKAELEDRLHAAEQQDLEDAKNEAKRAKTAMSSVMNTVADEYLCPITQELPVDPVMAEDGKFYERWAIEEWLGKQQRSPSTGAAMGTRLTPVTQVRNTIGHLVESGAIDDDKATAWRKKLEDEKELKELRANAEEGDADARYKLAYAHQAGTHGLQKDFVQSRAWSSVARSFTRCPVWERTATTSWMALEARRIQLSGWSTARGLRMQARHWPLGSSGRRSRRVNTACLRTQCRPSYG